MTLRKAVEIVEKHEEWKRNLPPYNGPHSPKELQSALDCLISIAKDVLANHKANE